MGLKEKMSVFLLLMVLLLGRNKSSTSHITNCRKVASCLYYYEGKCDSVGRRYICIHFNPSFSGCILDDIGSVDELCLEHDISGKVLNLAHRQNFCKKDLVSGGEKISFALQDGTPDITSAPGSYILTNGVMVSCSEYDNVCLNGYNDMKLTFTVSPCDTTTTTTKSAVSTTAVPPPTSHCRCTKFIRNDDCSVTCGEGTSTESLFCGHACVLTGAVHRTVTCVRKPCPEDGGWSDFEPTGHCTATCGVGVQGVTRTCDNPVPSSGGQQCEGPSVDRRPCSLSPCTNKEMGQRRTRKNSRRRKPKRGKRRRNGQKRKKSRMIRREGRNEGVLQLL